MLPSSSNVGVVTGWGKQGSVGEVHPNPLAELGVMCREKRQCWDAAGSGMLTASLLCPPGTANSMCRRMETMPGTLWTRGWS